MAQEIIDLDELAPPDARVKLGGKTYTLPGDIPVELYLRINSLGEDEEPDDDIVQDLRDQVLELFQVHQPDMDALPVGLTQLMRVIPAVYGPQSAEGNGKAKAAGTRSTGQRRRRSSS